MTFRWVALNLGIPVRVRLPFGSWWIAHNDATGRAILRNRFESVERHFVERFLKPGMTVLDIGAHHGYYTLLASQKVGKNGSVIAFEPSPRERARLEKHLRLNNCANVTVEGFALGQTEGFAELLIVQGKETGCNSLRPPHSNYRGTLRQEQTRAVRVPLTSLNSYLHGRNLPSVDFIKMDLEGGELDVLKGASELLARPSRPTILCEVQDFRTSPWRYSAKEIILFLQERGYRWYIPSVDAAMKPLPPDQAQYDGNFVAIPGEQAEEILSSIGRS